MDNPTENIPTALAIRQFQLVVDRLDGRTNGDVDGETRSDAMRRLVVPHGVGCLHTLPENVSLAAFTDESDANGFLVEPLLEGRNPRLLLIAPAGREFRVNGQPSPRLALLREGDVFQPDNRLALHLTLFHQSILGYPPTDLLGRTCPVCVSPLTGDRRIYVCAVCGTAMHAEGAERDAADRLECAQSTSQCHACKEPIDLSEQGHLYQAEFFGG